MLRKLSLLFLFCLLAIAGTIRAEVIVQLKPPPPGKLNVENLWSVTLKNMSQSTFKVYLLGQLTESSDGLIFEATTAEFDLPPGTTTVTVSDVSPINAKFPKDKYKSVLMQTGEVPSGNYTICVNVQMKNGSVLGSQCIPHTVNQVSGITLLSPENNANVNEKNPNFTWAPLPGTGNQYKFILAEKNGTPQQSLQTPEFEKTQNATFLVYPVSASQLEAGKTYYWQVALLDYQGNVLASSKSEIRSFTRAGGVTPPVSDGFIQLLSPQDEEQLNTSTINGATAFNFQWKKANTNKSISAYILKIFKSNNSNGRAEIDESNPFFKKEITNFNYNAEVQSTIITVEQGILNKGLNYFWKVEAFSQSYINQNNGIVGKSDLYGFKVTGGEELAGEITMFKIGEYDINVGVVSNKSSTNFAGDGSVKLWENGPVIYLKYDNIELEKINNKWKVKSGTIQNLIPMGGTTFKLEHSDTKSMFYGNTIRLDVNGATIKGYIVSQFPLTSKSNAKVEIRSADAWCKVSPITKLSVENLLCAEDKDYDLLEPSGFKLSFLNLKTTFSVSNNKLVLNMGGLVTLPDNIKTAQGDAIKIFFNDRKSLKFDQDLGMAAFTVPLNKKKDFSLTVNTITIDLIPKITWKGGVRISKGKINFGFSSGFNDIELNGNNIQGDMYMDSKGLTAKTDITGMSYKSKFYGFDCNVNKFYLEVKNNLIVKSNFKGGLYIPIVAQNLNYTIPITDNGIGTGVLDLGNGNLGDVYLFGNNPSEYDRLKMTLKSAVIKQDKIIFSTDMSLDNTKNENLKTGTMSAYHLYVKSNATIGFEESENLPGGWLELYNYSEAAYNNYDVTLNKIRFRNFGSGNFSFEVKGKIILAEDLSGPGGSDLSLAYKFYRNPNKGGSGSEISYANETEADGICVQFQNSETSYQACIYYKKDDVYGKAFIASFDMQMHNPSEYMVAGKIILGVAPQGYKYWFIEGAAEFKNSPIAIGIGDLGVYGFKGRLYSKMKHTGVGIGNNDYVPDGNTTFGIYAEVPFLSTSDDGQKIWGRTSLEVTIGDGFKSVLTGKVYVLSSGVDNTNAKIFGDAVITVSTSPAFFSADVNVTANIDNAVCGSGNMALYYGTDTWYLNVGTPQTPVSMTMYCSGPTATAYVDLNENNISFGAGYHVDTGPQHWAIFYGRAQGGVDISGTLAYSPFQFTGNAVISGSAELGFHYDVGIHEGNLTVLSGSVSANLEAQLPNPVCFAGKISARGCIWKFCKTVALKLRFKNGSFSFADHC